MALILDHHGSGLYSGSLDSTVIMLRLMLATAYIATKQEHIVTGSCNHIGGMPSLVSLV